MLCDKNKKTQKENKTLSLLPKNIANLTQRRQNLIIKTSHLRNRLLLRINYFSASRVRLFELPKLAQNEIPNLLIEHDTSQVFFRTFLASARVTCGFDVYGAYFE